MSERVSMKAIQFRLEWLNKALGRPVEPWSKVAGRNKSNAGSFHLDHQLGGYRIEMTCEHGGSDPVFGHRRMNKEALCDQLEAILVAIKLARGEESGSNWPNIEAKDQATS